MLRTAEEVLAPMRVPPDPALPRLGVLLDPDAMAPLLERSLGRHASLDTARIARVSYKPGERVVVHYEVVVDGRREDAVARAVAGHDLAAKADRARMHDVARRVNGRSPAVTPVVYEPDAEALLTWLPFDPRLPALAETPERLARRLGDAGLPVTATPAEPRLLSYKPGRRAVLRLDGHVLKIYGSARQFTTAAAGLRAGTALTGIATPSCEAVVSTLRLTAQAAIDGAPAPSLEAAPEAGVLLQMLQRAEVVGLAAAPDVAQLDVAIRKAALIGAVVPGLARRVGALVGRLRRSAPPAVRLVPAHGDFHAGQLLRVEGALCVLDLDSICFGGPALDLAEYAAGATEAGRESGARGARRPRRRVRRASGRARLAPRGRSPRACVASVPPGAARVAGSHRADGRRRRGCSHGTEHGAMKALVTGCAGFVGSHLTDALLADGHEVLGVDMLLDNYPWGLKLENLAQAREFDTFHFLPLDVSEAELEPLVDECNVVFHLAAEPGVRSSWGNRFASYERNNVLATQRLLEAVKPWPEKRVVYASSSSVYGEAERLPTVEETVPRPFSPYGVTKLAGEQLCSLYHGNFGLATVSLRYFSVYGPRQRPDMAFNRFCRAALGGEPLTVFGDGEQTRDFTFVGDVVAATRAAAVAPSAPGRVYNVGGGSRVSVNEALGLIAAFSGRPLDVRYLDSERGDVRDTGAETARARRDLGFRPATSVEDGLCAEFEWMREREASPLWVSGRVAAG